jgi:hypothetical protein
LKIKEPNIIAIFLAGLIMFVLSLWGYVEPEYQSIIEVAGSNAFWNFTFIEMILGFIATWFICYSLLYQLNKKS